MLAFPHLLAPDAYSHYQLRIFAPLRFIVLHSPISPLRNSSFLLRATGISSSLIRACRPFSEKCSTQSRFSRYFRWHRKKLYDASFASITLRLSRISTEGVPFIIRLTFPLREQQYRIASTNTLLVCLGGIHPYMGA